MSWFFGWRSISESLNKVTQLGQLIQQLLQLVVRDLCLQAGNQRLGFLGVVAAQTAYSSCISKTNILTTSKWLLTKL